MNIFQRVVRVYRDDAEVLTIIRFMDAIKDPEQIGKVRENRLALWKHMRRTTRHDLDKGKWEIEIIKSTTVHLRKERSWCKWLP